MSIAAAVSAILKSIEGRDVRPVVEDGSVWKLSTPGLFAGTRRRHAVEEAKRQIVRVLAQSSTAVITPPETPEHASIPGEWQPLDDGASWKVPADLDVGNANVAFWLFSLGSWELSAGAWRGGSRQTIDLFRVNYTQAKQWIAEGGPDVLIQSFYDDTDWLVLLHRPATVECP